MVIASLTAVFLRVAVVAISFVLPSLAATVDTASQVSRPTVEKRIVPDEPSALVRAVAMCGRTPLKQSVRLGGSRRGSVPSSFFGIRSSRTCPGPCD